MVFSLLFYKNTAFLPTFCDFLPTFLQNSQFFSLRFATCHVDRMGDISLFAFCLGGHPGPHLVMLSEVETSLSSRASCVYSNAVRTFKLSCRPHGRHLLVCVLLGRTHRSASCHVERSRNIFVFARFVGTRHAVSVETPSASLVPLNQEGQFIIFIPRLLDGRTPPLRLGVVVPCGSEHADKQLSLFAKEGRATQLRREFELTPARGFANLLFEQLGMSAQAD